MNKERAVKLLSDVRLGIYNIESELYGVTGCKRHGEKRCFLVY